MRILHVIRLYHPAIGGNELHIKELSEKLASLGEEVTVLTSNAANDAEIYDLHKDTIELPQEEIMNGVTVRRAPIDYGLNKIIFSRLVKIRGGYRLSHIIFKDIFTILRQGPLIPRMISEIIRLRPDIVLGSNLWGTQALYCYAAKKIARFPLVFMPCLHVGREWVENPLIYKIMKSADLVFALTQFEKNILIERGIKPEKVAVIGPGIDPHKFDKQDGWPFREKYAIGNSPVVTFVGRKVSAKGIGVLIDAMRLVWNAYPDARFVAAGTKTTYDKIMWNKIASLDEKQRRQVISLDNFSDEEKSAIYSSCDVFALPSVADSFGIVYLEAWLHRKPVIGCKDVAPATVIEHGRDGILVEYGNIRELAEAIITLLDNKDMRIRYGENGYRKVIDNYTWDVIAQKIQQKYHELVNKRCNYNKGLVEYEYA